MTPTSPLTGPDLRDWLERQVERRRMFGDEYEYEIPEHAPLEAGLVRVSGLEKEC